MVEGRTPKNEEKDIIHYYSFNQNLSCIAIGTEIGFKIFNTNPFQLLYMCENGGVGIVEMLYTTNLLAVVGLNEQSYFSQRRLAMWNTNNSTALCEISFLSQIVFVRMNKHRLVVCLRDKVHIYDISNMKLLQSLEVEQSLGRFVLSPSDNCYLVYSNNIRDGVISLFDAFYLNPKDQIIAHESPILKITLNFKGDLMATSSCKGTVIRIFSLPKGLRLYSFKRGLHSAIVFTMNFNMKNTMLVMTSSQGTIHIFKLNDQLGKRDSNVPMEEGEEPQPGGMCCGVFGGVKLAVQNIGAKVLNSKPDEVIMEKSSCSLRTDYLKLENIIGVSQNDELDGVYYSFDLDLAEKTITEKEKLNTYDQQLAEL